MAEAGYQVVGLDNSEAMLSHARSKSLEACFSCVKRHLDTGGHFIIDVFNPRLDLLIRDPAKRYPVAEYPDPDGQGTVVITENLVYDDGAQINRIQWYHKIGDKKEQVEELNMRIFYPQELDALLRYNGFDIEAKYGDYEEQPFTTGSPHQLPVCRLIQ